MNQTKAERRVRRKIARIKPCPFCGQIPKVEAYISLTTGCTNCRGHYAIMKPCCRVLGSGRTELFFTGGGEKPSPGTWWRMTCRLIDDWNRRSPR